MESAMPYAESFPASKAENLGMTAVGIQLVLYLLLQRRRQSGSMLWQRLAAVALSSVAAASFGSVLAQEAILGKVYDKRSLQLACRGMLSRIVAKLKGRVLSSKAKSFLAMLVLILMARKPVDEGMHSRRA